MIKIPYGQSDFRDLIEEGNFYQDRTVFIEKLEKWSSKYPVFLRPRRFGKSLFHDHQFVGSYPSSNVTSREASARAFSTSVLVVPLAKIKPG